MVWGRGKSLANAAWTWDEAVVPICIFVAFWGFEYLI